MENSKISAVDYAVNRPIIINKVKEYARRSHPSFCKGEVAIRYISCANLGYESVTLSFIPLILMDLIQEISSGVLIDHELSASLNK